MKRLLRLLLRLLALAALLLGIGLGALLGLVWWIGRDALLDRARSELLVVINRELSGSFAVERIDGSLLHGLELHGVIIRMDGRTVLTTPKVEASYTLDPFELLRGVVRIDTITVVDPRLDARVDDRGDIDFFEVFVPAEDDPDDEGSPVTVLIDRLSFDAGELRVHGVGPRQLKLSDLAAELSLVIPRHGITVVVPRAAGSLTGVGKRPIALTAAVRFEERDASGTLEIGPLEVDTGASRLSGSAVLQGLGVEGEVPRLTAAVEAAPFAARDLRALFGEWPLDDGFGATVQASGDLDSLALSGSVRLAGSVLPVAARLSFADDDPRFNASVEVEALALDALADELPLAGRLSGRAQAEGSFEQGDEISVDLAASVAALQVDGQAFGDLRAEGRLQHGEVRIHAEVEGDAGKAGIYATGSLNEEQPVLVGDAFFADFDLVNFLDLDGVPSSAVNATASLRLAGAADGIEATTTLYLAPSRFGAFHADTGIARLDFRDATLRIEEAHIAAGTARLASHGYLVLDSRSGSRLDASLEIPRLVLSDDDDRIGGAGRLEATARLRGLLRSPRLRLEARGDDLRSEGIEVDGFGFDADVGIDANGHATGTAQLRVGEVSGPVELTGTVIDLELAATAATQEVELDVAVDDVERGAHRLQATGSIGPDQARFRVDTLRLGTTRGTWSLPAPATLTHDRRGWNLSPLQFVSGERRIEARGNVPDKGEMDVSVRADGIDLAFLFDMVEGNGDLAGVLEARFDATGTVRAPRAVLRASIGDLSLAGDTQAPLTLDAELRDGTISAELGLDPDGDGWLRAVGSLPVDLRFDQPTASRVRGPLDARIEAMEFPLELFRPLAKGELRRLRGSVAADFTLTGDIAAPELRGIFSLRDGGARIRALKVDVADLTLQAELAPDVLRITTASAVSGGGRIDLDGEIALEGWAPSAFGLELRARRWPAIQTKNYEAQIGATLRLDGPIAAPELNGEIVVEKANLKPDLTFLDKGAGPSELDATITVIDTGRPTLPSDALARAEEKAHLPGLPDRIRSDLKLIIRRGTQVRHSMAEVDLTGELRIRKEPGEAPIVTGRIESRRGTLEIQGSEFKLDRAVVTFAGDDVANPRLDVVAIHRRSPYQIEARIGGSVKEPTLTLSSDPPMDQADILSVLLFGRPTTELDQGEKSTLQEQALNLTSGYAASMLGKAVTDALGLERLGLDLTDVSFTGGSVGFGRYIGANTYVSVTQHLDEDRGRDATIEYFFTPRWKIVTSTDSLGASGIDVIWQALY